jgi:AraC family transcriptional regulator of adaptative response/methylated-DNA-[protein]-cysteine methyltransferase
MEQGMASINDNLFTRLVEFCQPPEIGCQLSTRWGRLHVDFRQEGLLALEFKTTDTDALSENDPAFRDCFLKWLATFQVMSASDKWNCLSLKGTDFQRSVWTALLEVPHGATTSYAAIASAIGKPKAVRAVGTAVGANPVSLLIPCHRVLRSDGTIGGYRWGVDRKQAILDAEQKSGSQLIDLFL